MKYSTLIFTAIGVCLFMMGCSTIAEYSNSNDGDYQEHPVEDTTTNDISEPIETTTTTTDTQETTTVTTVDSNSVVSISNESANIYIDNVFNANVYVNGEQVASGDGQVTGSVSIGDIDINIG